MLKTWLLVIFLLVFFCSFSQNLPGPGLARDDERERILQESVLQRYQKDIAGISGVNKKYISDIYKERFDQVRKQFSDHEIITDPKAVAYLSALLGQVTKANPAIISSELRVLFSKAWWPNAASMGEGTIFFNIGLFNRLENESQAIFVLCHELAHYLLDHSNNKIRQYVATIYSDDFQKQLKSVQRTEYRQNERLESMAKKLSFTSHRHSREFEHAADSMALELMKQTGFDPAEALSCLALLDSVDKDKYDHPLELDKRFNFADFPFKKSWIESDLLMFAQTKEDEKKKPEEDSLKTHPDCILRIRDLTPLVQKYGKLHTNKNLVDPDQFQRLKQQFDFEIPDWCFEQHMVSRSLYFTLEMLQEFPDNVYLHTLVGKCLNELYSRQKLHELGKVVDLPGPDYNEEYNKLLHLIQNARLSELASLSYHYLQQYHAAYSSDRNFVTVWQKSRELANQ